MQKCMRLKKGLLQLTSSKLRLVHFLQLSNRSPRVTAVVEVTVNVILKMKTPWNKYWSLLFLSMIKMLSMMFVLNLILQEATLQKALGELNFISSVYQAFKNSVLKISLNTFRLRVSSHSNQFQNIISTKVIYLRPATSNWENLRDLALQVGI